MFVCIVMLFMTCKIVYVCNKSATDCPTCVHSVHSSLPSEEGQRTAFRTAFRNRTINILLFRDYNTCPKSPG